MPKIKGAHVLNAVKVLRHYREEAVKVLPPQLHQYLEERILASSWYPAEDHLELLRAVSRIIPSGADPWFLMGRGTAKLDLSGVYSHFLRPGEPEQSLRVLGAIWRSTHDSGEISLEIERPGLAIVTVDNFALRAVEICGIATGYIAEVLIASGANDANVVHASCRVTGGPKCVWRAAWTPPRPTAAR